jgi:ABC-type polar amino acid transport system ATPase subunit
MTSTAIEVRDLHLSRGTRVILNGAAFQAERGAVVALMGASGSGKTTLLRALAGLEPFNRGSIRVEDAALEPGPPTGAALKQLRRQVGMVFQFHCLFEHLPVLQNICLAPMHVQRVSATAAAERATALLTSLDVAHRANALPRELSGGEAQRVAIARALATDPPVLLMDEPTASLDPQRRTELARIVTSLVREGRRTLVIATHDEDFASEVATRIVHMVEGVVTESH